LERVLARQGDDEAAHHEGEQRGQDRPDRAGQTRLEDEQTPRGVVLGSRALGGLRAFLADHLAAGALGATVVLAAHAASPAALCPPPVIARPSSSSVALGGNSPTIRPS